MYLFEVKYFIYNFCVCWVEMVVIYCFLSIVIEDFNFVLVGCGFGIIELDINLSWWLIDMIIKKKDLI